MTLRVINDELYQNDISSYSVLVGFSFLFSLALTGICAYEIYVIATNIDQWSQSSVCIDNRILYSIWCLLGFLTLAKDVISFGCIRDQTKYRDEVADL